jgi:hypothetical protein
MPAVIEWGTAPPDDFAPYAEALKAGLLSHSAGHYPWIGTWKRVAAGFAIRLDYPKVPNPKPGTARGPLGPWEWQVTGPQASRIAFRVWLDGLVVDLDSDQQPQRER